MDIGGLDDRPPFLDFGFVIGRQRFRLLLLARHDDDPELREVLSHIGEITASPGCFVRCPDEILKPLPSLGWKHGFE